MPLPASAYRRAMSSSVRSICAAGTSGNSMRCPTIHLNDQNSECVSSASNCSGCSSHQRSILVNGRYALVTSPPHTYDSTRTNCA
ncbi:Uncharacterised protein [Mycobacteroides abscessus]|nr:Uncharacterised protein [Mycobacteroides abscessus]